MKDRLIHRFKLLTLVPMGLIFWLLAVPYKMLENELADHWSVIVGLRRDYIPSFIKGGRL